MVEDLEDRCLIWGTEALYQPTQRRGVEVISNRAGGRYFVTMEATMSLRGIALPPEQAKLTTWLNQQRRAGVDCPEITTGIVENVKARAPMSFSNKIDAFFECILRQNLYIGEAIYLVNIIPNTKGLFNEMRIACECQNDNELFHLFQIFQAENFLRTQSDGGFLLTEKGYSKLDELSIKRPDTRRVFVAMWFDTAMTDAFELGMKPAIEDAGFEAVRIDRKEHNNKIDDEIIMEIRRAKFIVADFTAGTINSESTTHYLPRGGVYYEAGFAMGLGIPVIWTVRSDQIGSVHFDTRQFAHITWTTPQDLNDALYKRIAAVIGVDVAPKFYPAGSSLQGFWLGVGGTGATGSGAEPLA